ncbi:hypothetical protein BD408DRAFT_479847 [Parasitella parasitica]|nr:hypothetical protein BD408DRAFT_479847 [Parasitella parasitica]
MGNSASKTKTFGLNLRNKISQTTGDMQEISSQRKLIELNKDKHNESKVSILKDNGFLNPMKKAKTPKKSPKKSKYKKVIVTKSIIGKPTNFKHLTCSKSYTDDMENGYTESPSLEAQMIALAALIKPLPDNTDKELPPLPVIPPRNSSYGNHIYLEQYAASLPSPPLSSPSSSSCSYFSTEMQHNIPSASAKPKKKSKNYPSIKKGKKTFIKYASIGKGSISRKQEQHDIMPRQKRKTVKLEEAVNSL